MSDKNKNQVSVYFSDAAFAELKAAASAQDRSYSWLINRSWQISRRTILGYPGVAGQFEDEELAS